MCLCVRVCVCACETASRTKARASEWPLLSATLACPTVNLGASPARFSSPPIHDTSTPSFFFSSIPAVRSKAPPLRFASTHRPGGQHGRVVVDVLDGDDGGGRVGEAKVQVALHVSRLHDDGVLWHFL